MTKDYSCYHLQACEQNFFAHQSFQLSPFAFQITLQMPMHMAVDIILPRYKEAWESFEPTVRAVIASSMSNAAPDGHEARHASSEAQSLRSGVKSTSASTPLWGSVLPWIKRASQANNV